MVILTPKQEDVYKHIKENGPSDSISVGIAFGKPRKLAERWATPALRTLVKHKKIKRDENGIFSEVK